MLSLIFRGVFLIGILTWYSTSVWKMIDGYFRDQFRSYLEEEYRKNPRMRSDVQGGSVDKADPVTTTPHPDSPTTVEPPRETAKADRTEASAVETAGNDSRETDYGESRVTGGSSENEAARGSTDKNAFQAASAESGLESRKSSVHEQHSEQSINRDVRDLERERNDDQHGSAGQPRRRIKRDRKPVAPRDISRENRVPRRRNVKTITLTDRDFKSVIRNRVPSDDFWEFEEDADEKEPAEGILVSELPFKPRADIGDLERVTAEEYCPLSLEDEASCDETFKWP